MLRINDERNNIAAFFTVAVNILGDRGVQRVLYGNEVFFGVDLIIRSRVHESCVVVFFGAALPYAHAENDNGKCGNDYLPLVVEPEIVCLFQNGIVYHYFTRLQFLVSRVVVAVHTVFPPRYYLHSEKIIAQTLYHISFKL